MSSPLFAASTAPAAVSSTSGIAPLLAASAAAARRVGVSTEKLGPGLRAASAPPSATPASAPAASFVLPARGLATAAVAAAPAASSTTAAARRHLQDRSFRARAGSLVLLAAEAEASRSQFKKFDLKQS
ncbi:60S ribosomal protein L22-like [Brachypodium distachyon]|uniref:60S ribosomal protein L22-like n=1 Tax=Brachypodium distachyon TaxID=15368 RepID=UPI00052FEC61|nr:60S ribosomal protein L22-like [Brachypodium distachyon]|eukprot:XP_010229508.1 60S ribosomal protein L22-like [Brachypodium distachyon]